MYEPREGEIEGGILICTYMYMCMHMTTTPVFAFVYMAFIFVCIYLGIALKSKHVWEFLYSEYIVFHAHMEKGNRSSQRKEKISKLHRIIA